MEFKLWCKYWKRRDADFLEINLLKEYSTLTNLQIQETQQYTTISFDEQKEASHELFAVKVGERI